MSAVPDSWIDQSSQSSNKGSDSILKVMSKSGANLRGLLRFNLPSTPAGCVLDTATLRMYASSASSSQRTLQVLRLNGSWSESGVTWSNQPATTGRAVTTTSGTGYRQWGVAALVQAIYSSGSHQTVTASCSHRVWESPAPSATREMALGRAIRNRLAR